MLLIRSDFQKKALAAKANKATDLNPLLGTNFAPASKQAAAKPEKPEKPGKAIDAPGGSGGIIIDNTVPGGGSQIYYSTRGTGAAGTPKGVAVQASQGD